LKLTPAAVSYIGQELQQPECILAQRNGTLWSADAREGVNFVLRDSKNRVWIMISTKTKNWMRALRTDLRDGYIARY
jgi:hypothetical protein